MWRTLDSAPSGIDVELAVIDHEGEHALTFLAALKGTHWAHAVDEARIGLAVAWLGGR
jgi:hypothetical protein